MQTDMYPIHPRMKVKSILNSPECVPQYINTMGEDIGSRTSLPKGGYNRAPMTAAL